MSFSNCIYSISFLLVRFLMKKIEIVIGVLSLEFSGLKYSRPYHRKTVISYLTYNDMFNSYQLI